MFRKFNFVGLCHIFVSLLLDGSAAFISNVSTQTRPPNVTVWDSPFIQLRARLPSYSQPIRPYNLLTSAEDYHYLPKLRHRRPSLLLHLLGSSFDPFWMSIDQPSDASGVYSRGRPLPVKSLNYTTFKENLSSSPELREAAAHRHQKLEKEAAELDLSSLPLDVARAVRDWLVHSATCELHYQWVDLGPAFWPRWLRQTDCERSGAVQSCSFPSGMECVRAQTTHLKILAWQCFEIRDGGDGSRAIKSERSDGNTEVGTKEAANRCLWRKVPYPVVTACSCSCK
uniref:noggin-like n=1 Tax=Monopterus albus TaxID=43700 RepID=UPI0009B3E7A9|nr:noggin-like [Monopterus albus]